MKSTREDFKIIRGVGQLMLDVENFASRGGLRVCFSSGELTKEGRWTSLGWPECSWV